MKLIPETSRAHTQFDIYVCIGSESE